MHPLTLYDCAVRQHEHAVRDRARAAWISRLRRDRLTVGPPPDAVPALVVERPARPAPDLVGV